MIPDFFKYVRRMRLIKFNGILRLFNGIGGEIAT